MYKWAQIATLGVAGGVIMGLTTSLIGLEARAEVGAWHMVYALWVAFFVARRVDPPFVAGFLASTCSGVTLGLVQVGLLDSYRDNNPWYAEELAGANSALIPGFLVQGTMAGLMFGVVVGAVTWALRRWFFQ